MLVRGSWDDFSHRTSFGLLHYEGDAEPRRIGTVKIIEKQPRKSPDGKFRPALSTTFEELGPKFISLGQDEEYYANLLKLFGRSPSEELLTALSDISWSPNLAIPFEPSPAFRNSLIRSNGAQRARRAGRAIIFGRTIHESPAFRYRARIPGASSPLAVDLDFDGADKVPGRIACLIGRNAVGKTQVLASLAMDLTQVLRRSKLETKEREDRFHGERPLFTRVIAVSYSTFDNFRRSRSVDTGYVYCGIRNGKGIPSISHLTEEYRRSIERVIEAGRMPIWRKYIWQVLDRRDSTLKELLKSQEDGSIGAEDFLSRLSSGETILTHLITALLSWLEPFSLVLFDEPETHLHPNAVANLFNALTDLLRENDSYALIATHSPVVLQEIPRSRVLVLNREGAVTTSAKLETESFGESLSELTRHVFETNEIENLYKSTLADLADDEPLARTLERFGNQLSQNARAYLLAKHISRG